MSLLENWRTWERWCAAVYSDYEVVLNHFQSCSEWDYVTFKKLVGQYGTVYLHQCMLSWGKKTDVKQSEKVPAVLMEVAKDFWLLHPMKEMLDNVFNPEYFSTSNKIPESRLKSMLGGFYLTFTMFKTCPEQLTMPKILMDAQDVLCFKYFLKCVAESKITEFVKLVIQTMLTDLTLDGAFELCAESHMVGIDPVVRHFRNVANSEFIKINLDAKGVKDEYVSTDVPAKVNAKVQELEGAMATIKTEAMRSMYGFQLVEKIAGYGNENQEEVNKADDDGSNTAGSSNTSLEVVPHGNPKEKFELVPEKFSSKMFVASAVFAAMSDVPSLSISNTLANLIVDRTMMSEARLRMMRLQAKKTKSNVIEKRRNRQPYVQEGGIFGRKPPGDTGIHQGEECRINQSDSSSTKPMWDYINTGYFPVEEPKAILGSPLPAITAAPIPPAAPVDEPTSSRITRSTKKSVTFSLDGTKKL